MWTIPNRSVEQTEKTKYPDYLFDYFFSFIRSYYHFFSVFSYELSINSFIFVCIFLCVHYADSIDRSTIIENHSDCLFAFPVFMPCICNNCKRASPFLFECCSCYKYIHSTCLVNTQENHKYRYIYRCISIILENVNM